MALRRIVLSRTDSIGDVILTLPMAGALRQRYPDLYIIFLGSSYTRPIVECCPYVNEFADWSKDTDLLILVDEGLLLCLPDPDTRNVIFDAA